MNKITKLKHLFRLPTEAEWEYAARSSVKTAYPWGGTIGVNNANCANDKCKDKYKYTASVGSFAANSYGLSDMQGNVWEWVNDWYTPDAYFSSPINNPRGSVESAFRVLRGGSWLGAPELLRSSHRGRNKPDLGHNYFGFRISKSS